VAQIPDRSRCDQRRSGWHRNPLWAIAGSVRYAVVASGGVWRSLVARFVRDEEAVGSNPATPTQKRLLADGLTMSGRSRCGGPVDFPRDRIPERHEGLHTEGPMGKAMLTIMAAFAQLERDTMIERTRAGLIAAPANGRKGGRLARSTTPMPPKHVRSGRRASRPATLRKCWESPAPPCIATFPTTRRSLCDHTRRCNACSRSPSGRGVGVTSTCTN
jgi:hypothetical protein